MSATVETFSVRVPAKINLSLEIIETRPDGYHELVSVMQTVGLWDTLSLTPHAEFAFSCSVPAIVSGNLVERAAHLLAREVGVAPTGHIHLEKHIPIGGGLGGGSSDAAAALKALSRLWDIRVTQEQLERVAESLGSDVPFFLHGGACLVEGRGERVRPLREAPRCWYLLINPGIHVSTADVFSALTVRDLSSGDATRALADAIDTRHFAGLGTNGLEGALARAYPDVRHAISEIREAIPHARLSGSGPTMFAAFDSDEEATQHAYLVLETGYWACVAPAIDAAQATAE